MLLVGLGAALVLASAAPRAASWADLGHVAHGDAGDPDSGAELLGHEAPEWRFDHWIGAPLEGESLRGKVVLVRWFMSTECPYCSATAPALVQLHQEYAARGLVVIGMYHHKRPEPLTVDAVRGWARDFGFAFPVAVDHDWATLKRWWLGARERRFTSVSFLVDKRGVIRHIHPGGTLAPASADHRALVTMIETLLAE
jgi:peroxiredoxin